MLSLRLRQTLLQRLGPLHRERPGHPHHAAHWVRLVVQGLLGGAGGDGLVHLIHLSPPGRAIVLQGLAKGLGPIGIGVERHFPGLPLLLGQQPTPAVGLSDGPGALAPLLLGQLGQQRRPELGRDRR